MILEKATLSRQIDIASGRYKMGNLKLSVSLLAGILGANATQYIMEQNDNEVTKLIKGVALGVAGGQTVMAMVSSLKRARSINRIANLIMGLQKEGINVDFGSVYDINIHDLCLDWDKCDVSIIELVSGIIKEEISEDGISYQYIDDEKETKINITDVVNENILTKRQKKILYYK